MLCSMFRGGGREEGPEKMSPETCSRGIHQGVGGGEPSLPRRGGPRREEGRVGQGPCSSPRVGPRRSAGGRWCPSSRRATVPAREDGKGWVSSSDQRFQPTLRNKVFPL